MSDFSEAGSIGQNDFGRCSDEMFVETAGGSIP